MHKVFSVCDSKTKADVVFVIHVATLHIKTMISDIYRHLKVGEDNTRVGLVTYADGIKVRFQLDDYPKIHDINRTVDSIW